MGVLKNIITSKQRVDGYESVGQLYEEKKLFHKITNDTQQVVYKDGTANLAKQQTYYIWILNNKLLFFPRSRPLTSSYELAITKLEVYEIHIDDIKYFESYEERYYENKITGGGGGVSMKGTITGAVIAGPTGAIIGSRGKNSPIKSNNILHNERRVKLVFEKSNNLYSMYFKADNYGVFRNLIKDKEKLNDNKLNNNDIVNKLEILKRLIDKNLISESDYNNKKNELLNKL